MLIILFILSLISTTFGSSVQPFKNIIVFGQDTTIEEFPWQVSIQILLNDGRQLLCGGSILSEYTVLTAAHCTDGWILMLVRAGSSYYTWDGEVVSVDHVIMHPYFNAETFDYDFSVLILSKHLSYGPRIQAIELIGQNEPVVDNGDAIVSGWGTLTDEGVPSSVLQYVIVPLVDQQVCVEAYASIGEPVTVSMFCAGFYESGGVDSCNGDSGGPLVMGGKLIGVVSWGEGCGVAGFPGVYSRVAHVREWIDQVLGDF